MRALIGRCLLWFITADLHRRAQASRRARLIAQRSGQGTALKLVAGQTKPGGPA